MTGITISNVICASSTAITLGGYLKDSVITISGLLLGPVAAGVVSGAIYGLVIRQNGSTGGTDIVAAWVRKLRPDISLVWVIFGLNASVACLSFFVYGYQFEPVILCILYCYLSSRISDRMLKGGKTALKFEVITQQAEERSARLMETLHHGVTVLPAQGMYSDTPRALLICVVNKAQIATVSKIVKKYPNTFAVMDFVGEVMGNFKNVDVSGKEVKAVLDSGDGKTL